MAENQQTPDRQKSLETAITSIEKQFGKGAVMRLGSSRHLQVEAIPTGSLSLDYALGVGGMPRGRIVEVFGPESSGKTTVSLHVIAQAQKAGGQAAFIDVEHALDPVYAKKLGVDTENLLIAQPSSGEEALEITEMLVRSNAIDIIVLDSVAALTSKAEIDGDMGDATVGMQARLMSQAMRKLTPVVSKSRCVCIFINQIREKIGVMFGNPETTPGGRALKFFSSVRIDIRRKEAIKEGDEATGFVTEVKVVKNKVAPPFRKARFDMMFGHGISTEGEVLDIAENSNIVNKSGAWYSFGDVRMGQGRENSKQFLRDNPDVFGEIVLRVKKALGMIGNETPAPAVEAKASEDKKKSARK
ncbi:MAG: recombinase RecA [Candidatus Riflebacteria bacterium HGW-Riflebacteria-2]|nr:MAG: recombinase RecA [Candidatus Riflebacteria bacterium HGW-Riflebacteria-2]